MVNIEYANAYSEVLEIIKYISREDYNKIPRKKIELFETKANKDYEFYYTPEKTLEEQNVSKRAKAIIAILFRDYWATETQKEKIIAKQKYDREQKEKKKYEIYNPNEIFKDRKKSNAIENKAETEETDYSKLSMIEYKENIIIKIINKIKSFFIRNK